MKASNPYINQSENELFNTFKKILYYRDNNDKFLQLIENTRFTKQFVSNYDMLQYAANYNNLDIIRTIVKKDFLDLDQINDSLRLACGNGSLELIKYFFNEPIIKNKINIHFKDDVFLMNAAKSGNVETVKYLLTSTDLKDDHNIHINNDSILRMSATNHPKLLHYLIFDYNIEKTPAINNMLSDNKPLIFNMDFELNNEEKAKVNKLFELRQLNNKLNNDLKEKNPLGNKIKI